ncbi:hypothetical protein A9973_14335 [Achromobacter sp. UMC46]|nr:hypothetical protein [Achromobacter sp. UMC46]
MPMFIRMNERTSSTGARSYQHRPRWTLRVDPIRMIFSIPPTLWHLTISGSHSFPMFTQDVVWQSCYAFKRQVRLPRSEQTELRLQP